MTTKSIEVHIIPVYSKRCYMLNFVFTGAQLTAAESSDLQLVLEELDVSTFLLRYNLLTYYFMYICLAQLLRKKMFLIIFILIIQCI